MKDGVGIINAARGGVLNEVELISALDSGKVSFAGLDTFENEPKPEIKLLMTFIIFPLNIIFFEFVIIFLIKNYFFYV